MREVTTNKVVALEQVLEELPQIDLDLEHYFAPGVYAREVRIPAGVVCTGKIHRFAHLNILLEGEIEIHNQGETQRMSAPYVFVSPPGTKRAGFALTDTRWLTIHPTESTDLDQIEQEVTVDSYKQLEAQKCLG